MTHAIYTEEEAKQKKCPNNLTCSCLGSECMKWSWHYRQVTSNTKYGYTPDHNILRTDKGFCNL